MAPEIARILPVIIPLVAVTPGRVMVPAPKVATINENIEPIKPPLTNRPPLSVFETCSGVLISEVSSVSFIYPFLSKRD